MIKKTFLIFFSLGLLIFLQGFLVVSAETRPGKGTVSGYSYNDSNLNRKNDVSEEGISGAIISLKKFYPSVPLGFSISKTKSDVSGFYEFSGLSEGVYLVEENDPSHVFTSTTRNSKMIYIARSQSNRQVKTDFGNLLCMGHGEVPLFTAPWDDMGLQCCAETSHLQQKEYYDDECTNIFEEYGYGGYAGICLACGDGICDSNYESKCNCPDDCED